MKKLKRLAAVLLAGIMALALFTACSDSDPGNPEFDPKVERAYQKALNNTFGTSFENRCRHQEAGHRAHRGETWRRQPDQHCTLQKQKATKRPWCGRCSSALIQKSSKPDAFVPLFYEAANTPNITPDKMSLRTLYRVVEQEIETAKKKNPAGRWSLPRWVSAQRPSAARPMLPSALS